MAACIPVKSQLIRLLVKKSLLLKNETAYTWDWYCHLVVDRASLFEYQHLRLLRDIQWPKLSSIFLMQFIFSTPVLIRRLWQLETVVFLNWCLICTVLFTKLQVQFNNVTMLLLSTDIQGRLVHLSVQIQTKKSKNLNMTINFNIRQSKKASQTRTELPKKQTMLMIINISNKKIH